MSEPGTTFQVDLTNCEREPIHLSGAIQPHGVLFVLSIPGLTILQLSANAGRIFDGVPDLGRPLHRRDPRQRQCRRGPRSTYWRPTPAA